MLQVCICATLWMDLRGTEAVPVIIRISCESREIWGRTKLTGRNWTNFGVANLGVANATKGTTILLVEQNANMALKIANRGYVLENGRIVLEGPAKELAHDPRVKEAHLGGEGRNAEGREGPGSVCPPVGS